MIHRTRYSFALEGVWGQRGGRRCARVVRTDALWLVVTWVHQRIRFPMRELPVPKRIPLWASSTPGQPQVDPPVTLTFALSLALP